MKKDEEGKEEEKSEKGWKSGMEEKAKEETWEEDKDVVINWI